MLARTCVIKCTIIKLVTRPFCIFIILRFTMITANKKQMQEKHIDLQDIQQEEVLIFFCEVHNLQPL